MRRHFYHWMSLLFWLLMVVGFSDNWWFARDQPSNSDTKYLIHAFFGSCWFTLLLVQTTLIRGGRQAAHMKVGLAGLAAFASFFLSTGYIYYWRLTYEGSPSPLSLLNMALFGFATVLIVRGLSQRKSAPEEHKKNVLIGSFLLMEPGISRSIGHLFGEGSEGLWLLAYLMLFGTFVWYYKRVNWQIATGFGIWVIGTANIIVRMM